MTALRRFHLAFLALLVAALVVPTAGPAPAQDGGQPKLLGQYGDWGAYTASPDGKKVCFVLSRPRSSRTDPPNRRRDQPYFFVSTRPAENVSEEVSVIFGYPLKQGEDATAEIGDAVFAMYTQNDGAWIKNVAEEERMVAAMRAGADMMVKGLSTRGTQTFDEYSLIGITDALERIKQECG